MDKEAGLPQPKEEGGGEEVKLTIDLRGVVLVQEYVHAGKRRNLQGVKKGPGSR